MVYEKALYFASWRTYLVKCLQIAKWDQSASEHCPCSLDGKQVIVCLYLTKAFNFLQTKLFPTIYIYWKKYQSRLLDRIKTSNEPIILSGDARHDSMGHSAKYGAYSICSNTLSSIVHFDLVQVIRIKLLLLRKVLMYHIFFEF